MLDSVWPNVYLNMWYDTSRAGQFPFNRYVVANPKIQAFTIGMAAVGLIPTALALLGAGFSARRTLRRGEYALAERGSEHHRDGAQEDGESSLREEDDDTLVDATLLLLAAFSLLAFVFFSWQVPTFAALKSSYLFNLSLPFGFFTARAVERLADTGWSGSSRAAAGAVGLAAAISAVVFTSGLLYPIPSESVQGGAVKTLFADYATARHAYLGNAQDPRASIHRVVEPLAAIEQSGRHYG